MTSYDLKGSLKILLDICNCSKDIRQKCCHATHKRFRPVYIALVDEDNSMVFTSHLVPFPVTPDLRSLVGDKNHFIFFTPVTVNKYSLFAKISVENPHF